MNKNIDLIKILKNCPRGTKFYTTIWGEVEFICIDSSSFPICIKTRNELRTLTKDGRYSSEYDAECILFPSKYQRDWNEFKASWYKKEKFDPNTLSPYDKVLVFDSDRPWTPLLFSYLEYSLNYPRMQCFDFTARKVIPYNKETEYLVGTHDEAPEYYRYWED